MEHINGQMVESMLDNGSVIKWKEKEHLYGLMEENMLVK